MSGEQREPADFSVFFAHCLPVMLGRARLLGGGRSKAIPYGIYDIAANTGWVNVGTDHDTAAFAVASIRRWWHARG